MKKDSPKAILCLLWKFLKFSQRSYHTFETRNNIILTLYTRNNLMYAISETNTNAFPLKEIFIFRSIFVYYIFADNICQLAFEF